MWRRDNIQGFLNQKIQSNLPPQFQQYCWQPTSLVNSEAFCHQLWQFCVQPSSSCVQIPATKIHIWLLNDSDLKLAMKYKTESIAVKKKHNNLLYYSSSYNGQINTHMNQTSKHFYNSFKADLDADIWGLCLNIIQC